MKQPHKIDRDAVYDLAAATQALGLEATTLKREVRLGRLRVSKRAGRYYLLGLWIIQWLENGEISRRKSTAVNGTSN